MSLTQSNDAAFRRCIGIRERRPMRRIVLDAQQASAELRRRQHAAGNVGDLELAQEEAFYQQEKLDVVRAEAAVVRGREQLNRLMGLWGAESGFWQVVETMPELP